MRKKTPSFLLFLLFLISAQTFAQERLISGQVIDEEGIPIPGASVYVPETSIGVMTDFEGEFTIEVPSQYNSLVVSYLGFQDREILLGDQTYLEVILSEDVESLAEVVVMGFGVQRERNVTGAVSKISADAFEDRPATNIGYSLAGKAAGVQVIRPSGKPQAGFSIRVRGSSSITAGNEPLYVIDGVRALSTLDLNPNNIESITVLKDAASAAIYGASGANGVVLITTKRGANQPATVKFQMYRGISQVSNELDVLNRQDYIELMQELGEVTNWDEYTADTNWQEEVFRNAQSQNYQLSLTGGSDDTKYYLSGSWTEQEGVVRNNTMNRYNFRVNLDQEVNDFLEIGTSVSYSKWYDRNVNDNRGSGNAGVILNALTSSPIIGIYNEDGTYTANPLAMSFQNPVAYTDGSSNDYNRARIYGNLYAEIDFLEELSFKSTLGYDQTFGKFNYFLDPFRTDWGRVNQGIAQLNFDENILWTSQNTLEYIELFDLHSVEALVGGIVSKETSENSSIETSNFSGISVPTVGGGSIINSASGSRSARSNVGFISRLNYSYADKYLITGNFRADASSVFGPDNKWGYFPSVSAGWRISDEEFFDVPKISDLKIRAGWGKVGNDGIGAYAWYGQIGTGYNYVLGGNVYPGTAPVTPENRALKWETTTQTNIGVDIALFDRTVEITANVYKKLTHDLLFNKPVAYSSGFSGALQNIGEVENKGFELAIETENFTDEFRWTSAFNISVNKNMVVDINEEVLPVGYISGREEVATIREGYPLGTFWGYVSEGVDPETGMIVYQTGEDGVLTDDDKTQIGNANSDFDFGLTNDFNYRNWSLSVFIQGRYGNDVFNATRIETEGLLDFRNQSVAVLNRWQEPGQITEIPRAVANDVSNSLISSRFVEDGSFARLKSVTLSYGLPEDILATLGLKGANIYFTGENIFTLTNYSGYDPEVSAFGGSGSFGIDYGTYPQVRDILVGLNLTF